MLQHLRLQIAGLSSTLRELTGAAQAIGRGDLSRRVDAKPGGEAGEVIDAFNQMAEDLETLLAEASQERERLLAALNSSADAVLAVNREGRTAFANAAAERLLSRTRDQLIGSPFAWAVRDERAAAAMRTTIADGIEQTAVIERPNHEYLEVTTTPIADGGDWAALTVFHDVTHIRRTEQVRRDFVANVSHELRTPLASIKSVIETLQGGALEEPAAAAEFLRQANQEIDRLVLLVQELLELSRIEAGELPLPREPLSLIDIVQRAADRIQSEARREHVTLQVELPAHLPTVLGDGDRLERVVINLIDNAVKFTPSGGVVCVGARAVDGSVTVTVADNGPGIARGDLPRVFERFYKGDRGRGSAGTGLGLAIVKHTVEAHRGSVSVESAEGEGSTFTFTLPAAS